MSEGAEILAQRVLRKISEERGYGDFKIKISPISTGGANYTSHLFVASITAGDEDLKTFIKVAIVSEKFRQQISQDIYFYERYMYRTVGKVFHAIQDKHNIAAEHRLKMPALYGFAEAEMGEVLVLEDLGAAGFGSHDRSKSFSWSYAVAGVTQLALLHSLFLAMKQDFPEEFSRAQSHLNFTLLTDEISNNLNETVLKNIELVREENRERVRKYFSDLPSIIQSMNRTHRRPALVHGDFRMSNLLHRENKNGDVDAVIVDYQTLHTSSVAYDLLYFIMLGSDKQFRASHFHQLLDCYYEQLSLSLTRLHLDPQKFFPREDFDYEVKMLMPVGLVFALFGLPVVTVAADEAAPLDQDLDITSIFQVKPSALCVERINDVVDDYISWGEL